MDEETLRRVIREELVKFFITPSKIVPTKFPDTPCVDMSALLTGEEFNKQFVNKYGKVKIIDK